MKSKKGTYTTKDIAKLANVSRGTVDRVLHKRGKVSPEAESKVKKILEEIDYKPNVLAKALQASKEKVLIALIPSDKKDEFWLKTAKGIEDANEEYLKYNLDIQPIFYDQNNEQDFKLSVDKTIELKPDGIAIAPFFYNESLRLLKYCTETKTPLITFNTHIDYETPLPFVGQNLKQSGQVAASLIAKNIKQKGKVLILHFDEKISDAKHMQEKEEGFRSYFTSNNIEDIKIQSINIREENQLELYDTFDTLFHTSENTLGVFVTTSKGYKLAQYLKQNTIKCNFVGYDLMQENIKHLLNDDIDYLIHQNPRKQAFLAASMLAEQLIMHKQPPIETLLPLDIIIKENINSYLINS